MIPEEEEYSAVRSIHGDSDTDFLGTTPVALDFNQQELKNIL